MNALSSYKTLTGLTLGEAIGSLQVVLPPEAYKPVPGTRVKGPDGRERALTDIDPAYLTEAVTEAFGPCGIGWWYQHDGDRMLVEQVTKTKRSGGTYDQWRAAIPQFYLYYIYLDESGEEQISKPVLSSGASDNSDYGYAIRGAITNAIAAAFAKLLWQNLVYKGLLHHENVRRFKADGNGKANGNTRSKSADKSNGKSSSKPKDKRALDADPATAQKSDGNGDLASYVVPFGANKDKTLAELSLDDLEWAAEKMSPFNEEGQAFQANAREYLALVAA